MELIRGLHNLRPGHRGCVATIGAFDGVHHGHRAVLQQLLDQGERFQLPTTAVVFEPLPREFFNPGKAPPRLMSFRERFEAMRELGVDRMLRIPFTERFRAMGAREFIRRVFVQGLGIRHIVVGDDLRFGRNRGGDVNVLRRAGRRYGFEVAPTETLIIAGERVSSTRIRQALQRADFALAEALLGRPYSISGRVIVGQQLGRTLGAPTANLQLRRLRAPLSGVYAVEVLGVEGRPLPGVANVGVRPTVDNLPRAILEVHLIDFSGDLYRRNITVVFRRKLREEIRFDSLAALQAGIQRDIQAGRNHFGLAPAAHN